MELRLGITTWAEVAGLIVSVLLIIGTFYGAVAWFMKLEHQGNATRERQLSFESDTKEEFISVRNDMRVVETRLETKVDSLGAGMNAVLIALGELKGQLRGMGNTRQGE